MYASSVHGFVQCNFNFRQIFHFQIIISREITHITQQEKTEFWCHLKVFCVYFSSQQSLILTHDRLSKLKTCIQEYVRLCITPSPVIIVLYKSVKDGFNVSFSCLVEIYFDNTSGSPKFILDLSRAILENLLRLSAYFLYKTLSKFF